MSYTQGTQECPLRVIVMVVLGLSQGDWQRKLRRCGRGCSWACSPGEAAGVSWGVGRGDAAG